MRCLKTVTLSKVLDGWLVGASSKNVANSDVVICTYAIL